MFWESKYKPKNLDDLDYNKDITDKLFKLSKHDNFPHMIFCGPSGAGKKTRIMAFLREFYGGSVDHIKIDRRNFKTRSNKPIELRTLQSNHHIEINPSDVGIYDEIVVQVIIKEIAQYRSLDDKFKVVLITEADKLSHKAQHGLRATIEKYSEYCKIIMSVESISKIIDPILSRCSVIRVPSPTKSEVCAIVDSIAKQENVEIPPQLIVNITNKTDRNLRRAVLILEALSKIAGTKEDDGTITLNDSIEVPEPDWEKYIDDLAFIIIKRPEPKTLLEARKKIYELLSNCIPTTIIFKRLCYIFIIDARKNDDLKRSIIYWCAHYEALSTKGQKSIYFLEAFISKIMVLFLKDR
jgi:replication factor C subunit 3/5